MARCVDIAADKMRRKVIICLQVVAQYAPSALELSRRVRTAVVALAALAIALPSLALADCPVVPRGDHLDPLGGGCYLYSPREWDEPFGLGKSGLRARPLCLPDACDSALTRDALAMRIVGRPVTDGEWDAYYARYSEYCRAEALAAQECSQDGSPPIGVGSGISFPPAGPEEQFSLLPPVFGGGFVPITPVVGGGTGGGSDSGPPVFGGGELTPGTPTGPIVLSSDSGTLMPAVPSPVPLPGTLGALLVALAGLILLRRK